jgi:hypothetical protein
MYLNEGTDQPNDVQNANLLEQKKKLAEHILYLQDRQRELVIQTAQELTELSAEKEPLLSEIDILKTQVAQLEQERKEHQEVIDDLRNIVRTKAEAVRRKVELFTQETSRGIDDLYDVLGEAPQSNPQPTPLTPLPVYSAPVVQSLVPTPAEIPVPALSIGPQVPTVQKTKKPQLLSKVVITSFLLSGIFFSLQKVGSSKATSTNSAENKVAGTFDDSIWQKSTDPEFGLSLDFPKNATNRVRIVGGSNLWFLRKNGYLLKIGRIQTSQTLQAWWDENKKEYEADYTLTKSTFKDLPAWKAESILKTNTSGHQYFLKKADGIYQIWIKDEDPKSDDGQRIQRMVESLQFTN